MVMMMMMRDDKVADDENIADNGVEEGDEDAEVK